MRKLVSEMTAEEREKRRVKSHERYARDKAARPDRYKGYWTKSDRKRARAKVLQRNGTGMTVEQYNVMLAEQRGVCAICNNLCSMGRMLSVDHDHGTGKIRGLLCGGCNVGLGRFRDSPELLVAAANYLNRQPKCGSLN